MDKADLIHRLTTEALPHAEAHHARLVALSDAQIEAVLSRADAAFLQDAADVHSSVTRVFEDLVTDDPPANAEDQDLRRSIADFFRAPYLFLLRMSLPENGHWGRRAKALLVPEFDTPVVLELVDGQGLRTGQISDASRRIVDLISAVENGV